MKTEEFQEKLNEQRQAALYGGWLTKYQHIERLGSDEVDGLLDGDVVVQPKIDGANATVAWDDDKGLIIATRNNAISIGGVPDNGMRGLVEFVLARPEYEALVKIGYTLRGEWLCKHSINYDKHAWNKLYIFDVQTKKGDYLSPSEYEPLLEASRILFVPVLAKFHNPTVDDITALVAGPDTFGAEQKEGVVVKNYEFVNKYGRVTWGKVVAADFRIKNKLAFGATKGDCFELRFAAAVVTEAFVLKIIHKIEDTRGTPANIRDMSQVIGRAWHEAFTEGLWDFVKNEHVVNFDFKEARRMVEASVRETALAYFNGTM